jgi:heterotetrameric sarcosine oxidase gamma subunit
MHKGVLGPCSIIRIQTWDGEALVTPAVEDILGVAWPEKTGLVARGRADVICLGPTDWLVVAADPDASVWLPRFETVFEGSTFRATNMSQALVRIQVQGPEVCDLLAKGCAIDLYPPLFPPGRAVRTRLAGMPVIVSCTGTSSFELIVTQSYADYLLAWLADGELEFETPV